VLKKFFRKNSKIYHDLGEKKITFLEYGIKAIQRILPHVEIRNIAITSYKKSRTKWSSNKRRSISITIGVEIGRKHSVNFDIFRRTIPVVPGTILRTLDSREYEICGAVEKKLSNIFLGNRNYDESTLEAVFSSFDDAIISEHLKERYDLNFDLGNLFNEVRKLAEQTYENKALMFGCLIDSDSHKKPSPKTRFPDSYFDKKKYRVLSDAYNTAYKISSYGCLISFKEIDLKSRHPGGKKFYPKWCENFARSTNDAIFGIILTPQGDILILENSDLTFTYRFGNWQYWNHTHLTDLLKDAARTPGISLSKGLTRIVHRLYRIAIDASFRRTGSLLVLLRNRRNLHEIVVVGDAIDDPKRSQLDKAFDNALDFSLIPGIDPRIIVELASLDGAIVFDNKGKVLAYGSVLKPKKTGKISTAEGSRTKAAIGASNYGIAIKVSLDGDIAIYYKGKILIKI